MRIHAIPNPIGIVCLVKFLHERHKIGVLLFSLGKGDIRVAIATDGRVRAPDGRHDEIVEWGNAQVKGGHLKRSIEIIRFIAGLLIRWAYIPPLGSKFPRERDK